MTTGIQRSGLWGVVLAGGDGRRLAGLPTRLGFPGCPKQFCPIPAARSMFEETVGRVEHLVPPERILAVVLRRHLRWAWSQLRALRSENILIQPENRETAPGMLLPAMAVAARDRHATIAFFPSDHFIREEDRLLEHVRVAQAFVESDPTRLILLGIRPDAPTADYGWMEPGDHVAREGGLSLFRVRRFWEKPDRERAKTFFRAGYLWNSFILIGKARQVLRLFWQHLPEVYRPFVAHRHRLGALFPQRGLDPLYEMLPVRNVSQDLLTKAASRLTVLPVRGVTWSDWGTEERILETLRRLGETEETRRRLGLRDSLEAPSSPGPAV